MSFIAGIALERKIFTGNEYHRMGKLWYEPDSHHCSLLLHGWHQGHVMAKPYDNDTAPYLKGDIKVVTDEYEDNGTMKKNYLWCGFIYTDTDQRGSIYQIILEVNPLAMLLANAVNRKEEGVNLKAGLFLSVHLEDKDERKKVDVDSKWKDHIPTDEEAKKEYEEVMSQPELADDELPF